MIQPTNTDQSPVVFLISPSAILQEYVARATNNRQLRLQIYDSFEHFILGYDDASPGCVVLCVPRYEYQSVEFLKRILNANRNSQVILSVRDWKMLDIVHAIQQGFVDFFDIAKDSERLEGMLTNAIERERKLREEAIFEIPETVLRLLNAEEIKIFRLIVQGKTTKQIGAELDLSIRTIHYRKTSIFQKLGVRDRSEAFETIRAIRHDNPSAVPVPHMKQAGSTAPLPIGTTAPMPIGVSLNI